MNTTDHFIGVFYLGSDMTSLTNYPPWWTSWQVDGVDLDSIDGYLITCSFEDDGRPIALQVENLSVGDADPRNPSFIISRIDSVLDTDGKLDVDDLPPELADEALEDGDDPQMPIQGDSDLIGKPLGVIERWAIEETLRLTNDNRDEAAKILQIGARTLYRRLDQYKKDEEE